MADRDNVIRDLRYIKSFGRVSNNLQLTEIAESAIELLKEQEAVEPFHKCIGNEFSLIEDSHFDYCPYCGKPVTWAKQEGR